MLRATGIVKWYERDSGERRTNCLDIVLYRKEMSKGIRNDKKWKGRGWTTEDTSGNDWKERGGGKNRWPYDGENP